MSVDKLVTDILGERPTVKDPALRDMINARMKAGGEVKAAGGGIVRKAMKAIQKAAESADVKMTPAIKDLTTMEDAHTGLMDSVREKADQMRKVMEGFEYKYKPGEHVFTESKSKKPLPPWKIIDRQLSGNMVMREPVPPGTPALMGKIVRDPETGKPLRTPYEPGYKVRREYGPDDWEETIIPESGILGRLDPDEPYAKGGEVKMGKGGLLKKAAKVVSQAIQPELPDILKSGTNTVDGAAVTLRHTQLPEGRTSIAIDRIEVPEDQRRKGVATKALKSLVQAAEDSKSNIELSAAISPDDPKADWGLERAFTRAGFTSDEFDGEIYPMDKTYVPSHLRLKKANGGAVQAAPYGLRETSGMPKGKGYFGELPTADGVMTELSASDDAGDFPLIVPTLTAAELKHLQSGGEPTAEIYAKAKAWAESRKGQGRDPFATSEDLRMPVPEYAKGGEVRMADGGPPGKNVGRGMAGLRRSRQPLDPKEIQAMMLDVPAGVGIPFAEAGAEYLRGNVEDAETSAAIDAALTAVPVVGALAKPAYRAVKSGVKKAAPAVREAARGALESGMESGLIQGPSYAVKPTGGQWLGGYKGDPRQIDVSNAPAPISDETMRSYVERLEEARNRAREYTEMTGFEPKQELVDRIRTLEADIPRMQQSQAIRNWVDSNLNNYVRKQMGTPDDPVLKLAEQGILHMPYQETGVLRGLAAQREKAGFPAEGLATTDLGRMWETISDRNIASIEAGKLTDPNYLKDLERRARENDPLFNARPGRINDDPSTDVMTPAEARDLQRFKYMNYPPARAHAMEENQWLSRVDPETPIYSLSNPFGGSMTEQDLGFDHVIDVLRADLAAGRIRPEQLSKMSMEQAVRRTHEYDLERAAAMAKAAEEETANLSVAKSFDDGFKIVQLDKPGQFAKESDRMGHSVRGYEPSKDSEDWIESAGDEGSDYYGHGGWGAIKSGDAQVFSIRDAKNQPHVTIELGAKEFSPIDWVNSLSPEEKRKVDEALKDVEIGSHSAISRVIKEMPEYQAAKAQQPKVITQIKGKQNRKPDEKYLPYVQQFIREGNYEIAGDLRNSGLIDLQSGQRPAFVPTDAPRYVTQAELDRMQRTGKFEPDFKEGGAVEGYAKGGAIKSLIKKASEALGEHEGKSLLVTQSDRTKVGGKFLGGPGFSSLQLTDPFYKEAEAVWGVGKKGAATKMINAAQRLPEGKAIWSTMIGSPEQHKSNQQVFDELLRKFRSSAKEGNLDPDLRERINAKLASAVDGEGKPLFPEGVDIMSPKFRQIANTFDRRAIAADAMGGVQLGGKKGQIIDYSKIIESTTDPLLIDQPTHAIGPRLFQLQGDVIERPDLHPAYPFILTGEDLATEFVPVPRDIMLRDFVEGIRQSKGREPGFMDLTRNTPSQFLSEEFLTGLQKSGFKKGGPVKKGALPTKRA